MTQAITSTGQHTTQHAVIYCRVSSTAQVKRGHGLESQETRCRQHAEGKGYHVDAVFPDDASGGGDFIHRPGMVALLSFLDAQPDKSYVVIFDDLKRFARDTEFHRKLRRELMARDARPECLNFRFEDTPEGEFIETIMAAQGELERKQNRRQVIQKMKARAEAGYWLFHPPYGYRFEKVPGHGKMLVPNEPQASVVTAVLERFANGQLATIAEAKRFLDASPAFADLPASGIKFDGVKAMLERPIYAGYISIPKWDMHLIKGQHQPLISFKTYQEIQERLNWRPLAPVRKDTNALFPLRGFISCNCCGAPMTGALSKGRSRHYAYYFCNQKSCTAYRQNIRGEKLHGEFETFLQGLRPKPQLIETLTSIIRDLWQERLARASDEAKAAKTELQQIEAEIERTLTRAVEAENPALIKAYETKVTRLEEKRIALTEKTVKTPKPRITYDATIRTALEFLLNPWKLWVSERIEDRNLTLKLVFAEPLAYCRERGIRTGDLTLPFKVLAGISTPNSGMVGLAGLEPATRPL